MSHSELCVKSVAFADSHTLHAGDLKTLPATDSFPNHNVIAPQRVGLGLGEFRAFALAGAAVDRADYQSPVN